MCVPSCPVGIARDRESPFACRRWSATGCARWWRGSARPSSQTMPCGPSLGARSIVRSFVARGDVENVDRARRHRRPPPPAARPARSRSRAASARSPPARARARVARSTKLSVFSPLLPTSRVPLASAGVAVGCAFPAPGAQEKAAGPGNQRRISPSVEPGDTRRKPRRANPARQFAANSPPLRGGVRGGDAEGLDAADELRAARRPFAA